MGYMQIKNDSKGLEGVIFYTKHVQGRRIMGLDNHENFFWFVGHSGYSIRM